tara:strand:- start:501 stop:623 length:123 start_codon:yes stop_codon:yes gene_type:complete
MSPLNSTKGCFLAHLSIKEAGSLSSLIDDISKTVSRLNFF